MDRPLIAIATLLTSLTVSAALVRQTIPFARERGLLDQVGPRRVNPNRLPRIAGPAVLLGFLAGLAVTWALSADRFPEERNRIVLLVIAAILLVVVMIVDDLRGISPLAKLAWQIAICLIVVLPYAVDRSWGIAIDQFNLPIWGTTSLGVTPAILFTLFWIVGMMNTINLVDGLDGLAGGVTFIACAILFAHTYFQPAEARQFTIALLPLALAGAVLGFLPFNWHPARIIMGDCGANFLGFVLAAISIIGGAKLATTMLALAIPILDVAWLIVARLVAGHSPAQRDTRHLHHRLYELGLNQRQVVLIYYGLCLIFGAFALLLEETVAKLIALFLAAFVLGILLIVLGRMKPRGTRLSAR